MLRRFAASCGILWPCLAPCQGQCHFFLLLVRRCGSWCLSPDFSPFYHRIVGLQSRASPPPNYPTRESRIAPSLVTAERQWVLTEEHNVCISPSLLHMTPHRDATAPLQALLGLAVDIECAGVGLVPATVDQINSALYCGWLDSGCISSFGSQPPQVRRDSSVATTCGPIAALSLWQLRSCNSALPLGREARLRSIRVLRRTVSASRSPFLGKTSRKASKRRDWRTSGSGSTLARYSTGGTRQAAETQCG